MMIPDSGLLFWATLYIIDVVICNNELCSSKRLIFYGNAFERWTDVLPDCFTANDISADIDHFML